MAIILTAALFVVLWFGVPDSWTTMLLQLKRAAFAIVNVPAGLYVLAHGYWIAGTTMLGIGLAVGIDVAEHFWRPLPRPMDAARSWALGIGSAALVVLLVQILLGCYPPPEPKT